MRAMARGNPLTRLAAMPGTKRLAPLLAVLAVAAGVAGCGSSDIKGTIPESDATAMNADLDAVEAATERLDCPTAEASAHDFTEKVNLLPATVGEELKGTLQDAAAQLEQQVKASCASGATGATGQHSSSSSSSSTTESTATTSTTATDSTTSTEEAPPPSGAGNQGQTRNEGSTGNGQGGDQGGGDQGGDTGGAPTGGTGGTGGTGVGGGN
jgi:hypothetical protein